MPVAGVFVFCAGTEDLPGYGPLAFTLTPDGRAVMADAKGTWPGRGKKVTLRFYDGRVIYTGNTTWAWSVQIQAVGRAIPGDSAFP